MTDATGIDVSELGDAQLLRLFIAKHDEAAFARLVCRHGPMVLGVCRRMLRSHADADDAFQTSFLLLAMKAATVHQPELLGNWLFGVATHTATGIRRANVRRIAQEEQIMRILQQQRSNDSSDPDLRLTLDEQILRLPDKLRQVTVCCYLQGMTHREAATKLKMPESTVSLRVQQARELLKQRLSSASDSFLTTTLIPVAVPAALAATSVKAATLAVSGQALAAHAIAAKSFVLLKQTLNAVFVAKVKFGAALLLISMVAVAVVSTAAMTLQGTADRSGAPQSLTPPTTKPSGGNNVSRIRRISASVMLYANRNGFPANLSVVGVSDPMDYLGSAGIKPTNLRRPQLTVIVAERPAAGYDGPIALGFLDAHAELLPQAVARQKIDASKAAFAAARAGATNLPAIESAPVNKQAVSQMALPQRIRDALAGNASRLSPISISWTKLGSSPRGVNEAVAKTYVSRTFFEPLVGRTVWQEGKLYGTIKAGDGVLHETGFDGLTYSFAHAGHDPQMSMQSLSDLPKDGTWFTAEYLNWVGIHLPSTAGELQSRRAVSQVLWMLDAGASLISIERVTLDSRPMTRLVMQMDNADRKRLQSLPAKRDYVYYLDPGMNLAVRREEERYGQQLLLQTDNEDFQKLTERDTWLPHRSVTQYFTYPTVPTKFFDEPILREAFTITEMSLQAVPDTQFVLSQPNGARVFDRTQAMSTETATVQPMSGPITSGIGPAWVISVSTLIIAVLAFVFWKRKSPQLFR